MEIQTGTMWKPHKIFFKTSNLWGVKPLKMPALKRPRLCPSCPSKPSWPASDRPVPPGPERLWFFALWPQGHRKCNGKLMENDGNNQIAHQRLDERYQEIKDWWTLAVFSGNRWYPTAGLDATCVDEVHSFKPSSTHDSVYIDIMNHESPIYYIFTPDWVHPLWTSSVSLPTAGTSSAIRSWAAWSLVEALTAEESPKK